MNRLPLYCAITVSLCLMPPALAADTVQSMVNQGTALANQEKYDQAIPYYEKALSQLPAGDANRKTLGRNLGVLYSNAAVIATNEKKYDQALAFIEKALVQLPNDGQVKKTKGSIFFHQAMDIRDAARDNPDAQNFEKVENLLRNALQWDPNEVNFKRALAANYNDNALAFAANAQYEDAAKLLEAALQLEPNNSAMKVSLRTVYLNIANQHIGEPVFDEWAKKALAVDPSPDTQREIDQMKSPVSYSDHNVDEFTRKLDREKAERENSEDEQKPQLPASARKLSMSEMLLDVENQLGIPRDAKLSLKDRVENVEKQLKGKPQEGALAPRVEGLYASVFGTSASSQPELVQAPAYHSEDSYLDEIFKITDGKVIRWGKFPLRVYVEDPTSKEDKDDYKGKTLAFKPEYKDAVLKGLEVWKEATIQAGKNDSSFITYVPVKSYNQADVVFKWDNAYVDQFADPEKSPKNYDAFVPPKTTKLQRGLQIASMFTPGIFSLAPQAVVAGMQYRQAQKLEIIRKESEVTLGLDPVKNLPDDQALLLIQNMAAKEFGHILGLKCASNKEGDLLYPALKSDTVQTPSRRDLETLRQLYGRPANIVLNVNINY